MALVPPRYNNPTTDQYGFPLFNSQVPQVSAQAQPVDMSQGPTPGGPAAFAKAAPWVAAGMALSGAVAQWSVADTQAQAQRESMLEARRDTRRNALESRQRLGANLQASQDELRAITRVQLANEARESAFRRSAAAVSASDRGVSGRSTRDLQTVLDIQEAQELMQIEARSEAMGLRSIQQAADVRRGIRQQVYEVERQALPERPSFALSLLQGAAQAAQSYAATKGAYTQGAASAAS
jgi:hypothetical protein